MPSVMIALVGEQPLANLLPIKHCQPAHVVLVDTDRTSEVSMRLRAVLGHGWERLPVPAFDMFLIEDALSRTIADRGWAAYDIVFNLTSGTKPMLLAAYRVAERLGSPFMYLQTEGGKSMIYRYTFAAVGPQAAGHEEIPAVIDLDEYLKVHLGDYHDGAPINASEQMVADALGPVVGEMKASIRHGGALELDLALRCKNQVAIAEVKTGRVAEGKSGIDQLNAATEQRYLGTYTRKFLILDRPLHRNNAELAKAYRITVIVLPSMAEGALTEADRQTLVTEALTPLGRKP